MNTVRKIKNSIKRRIHNKNSKILIICIAIFLVVIIVGAVIYSDKVTMYKPNPIIVSDNPNFYREEGFKMYQDQETIGKRGIDISEFQGDVDWNEVKRSGVEFAILRCGYRESATGEITKDSRFLEYVKGANSVGIEIGAYFFSQAVTVEEAQEEADFTLEMIKGCDIRYPIGYDMEWVSQDDRINEVNWEEKTKVAKAFCHKIQQNDYETMIYGNTNWLNNQIAVDRLAEYNIWLANYTKESNYSQPIVCWQYNNEGTIYGIKGNVDLDIFFVKK